VCEQLAQSREVEQLKVKTVTFWQQVWCAHHYTTTPTSNHMLCSQLKK